MPTPMQKRDYYEILSVSRTADGAEIKKSYRRLAMEFHPDRNPGDQACEERFKECAEAYEVLSDPEKRKLYDAYGHDGPRRGGFEGFSSVEDIFSHMADFFGGGFAGGGGGRRVERGDDVQVQLRITFMEAARGCQKPLELQRLVHCEPCKGSGGKAGAEPTRCGTCGGRGQVAHNQGIFMVATTCPTCRGRGEIIRDKCEECRGSGLERKKETVSVSVPAGIAEGQTLRVPGKGQAGPSGGPAGHLYVVFEVERDERFERDGDDLFVSVPLTYAQASLGATVKVPTLDGEIDLKVDAGTQPGTIKVLRGKGMPNVHGRGTGDLGVRLTVRVPSRLDDEHRRAIEALALIEGDGSRFTKCEEGGFFGAFKKKKKKG